mmetsp:Transcript_18522/g.44264  ORF Transcript_18522/g.44264 Transcript_18522/m.44264 type:complete len:325 (-) Transcript_18522:581-1555(-)
MSMACIMLSAMTLTKPRWSPRAVMKNASAMKWYSGALFPASEPRRRCSTHSASSSADAPSLVSPENSTLVLPEVMYLTSSRCQAFPVEGSTKGSHSFSSTAQRLQKKLCEAATLKSICIFPRSALSRMASCSQRIMAWRVSLLLSSACTAAWSPACRVALQERMLCRLARRSACLRFSRFEKHICRMSGCCKMPRGSRCMSGITEMLKKAPKTVLSCTFRPLSRPSGRKSGSEAKHRARGFTSSSLQSACSCGWNSPNMDIIRTLRASSATIGCSMSPRFSSANLAAHCSRKPAGIGTTELPGVASACIASRSCAAPRRCASGG